MIRFPDQDEVSFSLTNRLQAGRCVWTLNLPIDVWMDHPGVGSGAVWVTIPTGFETDGASIPWWARPFLDPWARIGLAAVLHDYLLTLPAVAKWDADLALLHALRSQGVPAFLSTALYLAVRIKRRPDLGASASIHAQPRRNP